MFSLVTLPFHWHRAGVVRLFCYLLVRVQGIIMCEARAANSAGYFITVTNSPWRFLLIPYYFCMPPSIIALAAKGMLVTAASVIDTKDFEPAILGYVTPIIIVLPHTENHCSYSQHVLCNHGSACRDAFPVCGPARTPTCGENSIVISSLSRLAHRKLPTLT